MLAGLRMFRYKCFKIALILLLALACTWICCLLLLHSSSWQMAALLAMSGQRALARGWLWRMGTRCLVRGLLGAYVAVALASLDRLALYRAPSPPRLPST